jgi:hypothetical protein
MNRNTVSSRKFSNCDETWQTAVAKLGIYYISVSLEICQILSFHNSVIEDSSLMQLLPDLRQSKVMTKIF